MRIAVCGAGVSGLALAGILSRNLRRTLPSATIHVFERASADRDQGYGLDLDAHGQVALAKAGVSREQYWAMSRPHSDSAVGYFGTDEEPAFVVFQPKLLQRWFPSRYGARPESNRSAMRQTLLDLMASRDNVNIHYNRGTFGARLDEDGVSAVLLDQNNNPFGDGPFDLVIDAMGVHSTLRQHRVLDHAGGRHPSGLVMLHGVVQDPESTWSSALLSKMKRHGSMFGVARGYNIFLQRFGAGPSDNRTSFFYLLMTEGGEKGVFKDVGIEPTQSRASGIMTDERLKKVKDWIHADMEGVFAPFWKEAVESIDRITIREQMVHGATELLPERTLPIVCVGDSLWNCGLGGGGILALQDVAELGDLMLDINGDFLNHSTGTINLNSPALLKVEQDMLERKRDFNNVNTTNRAKLLVREPGKAGTRFEWKDVLPGESIKARAARAMAATFVPPLSRAFVKWYDREFAKGIVGSDESSPIYPSVQKVLDQELR